MLFSWTENVYVSFYNTKTKQLVKVYIEINYFFDKFTNLVLLFIYLFVSWRNIHNNLQCNIFSPR